jgi:hypothetical protein
MSKIDIRSTTREVVGPDGTPSKTGGWKIWIEGGFNEPLEPIFEEAVGRVKGLIAGTKDAESFKVYAPSQIEGYL